MNEVKTNDRRKWGLQTGDEDEAWLYPFEEAKALALARIEGGETMTLIEWRPPTAHDVDVDCWTDRLWQWFGEQLEDDPGDGLETADGYTPRLGDFTPAGVKRHLPAGPGTRVGAWDCLREALWQLLRDHGDFSDAAWQPTGATFVVSTDENPWRSVGEFHPVPSDRPVELRSVVGRWRLFMEHGMWEAEPLTGDGTDKATITLTDDAEWRYSEVTR